jgi:hypothetical protein
VSEKSNAGKAAWAARASTYQQDLADEIATSSKVRMDAWTARDRIPMRVRVMARLSARPLHLPTRSAPQ